MTITQAQHDYANRDSLSAADDGYPHAFPSALECMVPGTCYWCGAPCKVTRLPYGHITVPWCGCGRVGVEE